MKHLRKISSLLLISMLAGLVACGTQSTQSSDSTASADTDADTTAQAGEYTDPGIDFNGETFTVAANHWSASWQITSYDPVSIYEENGDVLNDAIVRRTQQVEEQFNLKLKLLPITERNKPSEFTTPVLAGEDAFKFGMVMSCGLPSILGTEGMLVDLAKIGSIDLSKSWWDANAVEEMNLFGVQYAALGDVNLISKGSPVVNYFNKQIIEDHKLGDMYELVDSGKWTLDTMMKLVSEVSSDLNADGKPDLEDRYGFACESSTALYMLYSNGLRFSEKSGDTIKLTIMNEKTVDALDRMMTVMRDKSVTLFGDDWYGKGYNNVYFDLMIPMFAESKTVFYSNQLHVALNMRSMEVDFGILPMPKYDEKQENYISFGNSYFNEFVVVPSTNTDLERTGHVIEALNYYSQQYVTPALIDNVIMAKSTRDEDSGRMIELVYDTMAYDIAMIFNWGKLDTTVTGMRNSDKSYTTVYAENKPAIEDALNQTIEQLGG